jgi:hypothetical protein
MKKLSFALTLFASAVLPVSIVGQTTHSQLPEHVSMFQLIATPERFDGKLISVVGFLTLGREADDVFPYELDVIHLLTSNAVAVERTKEMEKNEASLNRKYVHLIGIFRKADKEQLGVGLITKITTCQIWSDPNLPISRRLREIPGLSSTPH